MKTILCLSLLLLWCAWTSGERQKRFLIVPPTAPTRHQWIAGIGIPLDLENIAVTTGYVLKAQYFLPTKVEHLFPLNTWEDIERTRRDIRNEGVEVVDNSTGTKYTKYDVPVVVVEEAQNNYTKSNEFEEDEEANRVDFDLRADSEAALNYWNGMLDTKADGGQDTSRWDAYKALEGLTASHGMGGKDCVLRTICESGAAPISHKSGILGELVHILLTPSSSDDMVTDQEHENYLRAEKFGSDGRGSCEEEYPDCDRSLLDVITTFENPFESLFLRYA